MRPGANYLGNGSCEFVVWAPFIRDCSIRFSGASRRTEALEKDEEGYFKKTIENIKPGARYFIDLEGKEYPDPASNYQPEGVHGPSEVIDHDNYSWKHTDYDVINLRDLIVYELHIGTFTPEGTYEGASKKLEYLVSLGITALEIMPLSQFPGDRNWGYDGVLPYAPQNSYGHPDELKSFIDECHHHGLLVILDVVYNHFGPEGNYLRNFGPYFTTYYRTPWGDAINFDKEYSDDVRNYFFENALYWLSIYNFDGLRLDAIDQIYDHGAKHFLAALSEKVEGLQTDGKKKFLIAESDLNDTKVIRPLSQYGYGCSAQWNDDFHHSLHALLTGEKEGYYADFGKISHLVTAYKHSFVYSGKYSQYRKKTHGQSAADRPAQQFIVCTQNHDQVGNRAYGRRLSRLVSFEGLKLAAGALLFSPYVPLLFMGEEYGEQNPFLYFISHNDPELIHAVREGRKNEFRSFKWNENIPDPYNQESFEMSKLNWDLLEEDQHRTLFNLYKELINLRKSKPALQSVERGNLEVSGNEESKIVLLHRWNIPHKNFIILNFNKEAVTELVNVPQGKWEKIMDSASEKWMGPGTSTPDELVDEQQNITIKGLSFSAYETKV